MKSKKLTWLFSLMMAGTLVFGASWAVCAEEAVSSEAAVSVEETVSVEAAAEEEAEEAAPEESEGEAIPTVEGSIFIAPLRPENAQALMDLFAEISGEEGKTSYDLAMLLAGEDSALTDEETDALMEELDGYDYALSYGYLTETGSAMIDAAALGLEDGDIIKSVVLIGGKPAIVEAAVEDGVCSFEVTEPSVCFAFAVPKETEEVSIPTAEGSIFVAPLRPENAQPLMDLFAEINGEEGKTSYDLAMLLAGEDNELTDEETGALKEALEGCNSALSNGYLTETGTAIFDAEALGLADGDVIKCVVLNGGKPAIVEATAADGVCSIEVTEPSVCFVFGLSK